MKAERAIWAGAVAMALVVGFVVGSQQHSERYKQIGLYMVNTHTGRLCNPRPKPEPDPDVWPGLEKMMKKSGTPEPPQCGDE